ncbi:MAG: hypothetical protein M3254_01955, partial [Actinomycetota bacterium]|nr:hypothetical protein [Actinomycetota bacterium]
DGDTGPNGLQNVPDLSSATTSGNSTTIEGSLDSTGGPFTIQFFSSPEADGSGNGEGKKFLDELTGVAPNASFTATTLAVPAGEVVTATATNETTKETSEFSAAETVV